MSGLAYIKYLKLPLPTVDMGIVFVPNMNSFRYNTTTLKNSINVLFKDHMGKDILNVQTPFGSGIDKGITIPPGTSQIFMDELVRRVFAAAFVLGYGHAIQNTVEEKIDDLFDRSNWPPRD